MRRVVCAEYGPPSLLTVVEEDDLVARPGGVVVDVQAAGVNFVDAQGAATLADVVTLARDAGVHLRLTRIKPGPRKVLEREGVIDLIGVDHIHGNIHRAVEAEHKAGDSSDDRG